MRPTLQIIRRTVTLAVLVVGLFVGSAAAGSLVTFPAGTFIVPVQGSAYPAGGTAVLTTYGMMYRFLQQGGVAAYRAIDADKATADALDFTVSAANGNVVENYHGTTAPGGSRVSYLGGAWLIVPHYQGDLDAVLADPTWSGVQVHRALVPFAAPVTEVHQVADRAIALLVSGDETEAARARQIVEDFLQPSGLAGALATMSRSQIIGGALSAADAPAILLVPYARPLTELSATDAAQVVNAIRTWVQAGNTLIAQDDAVEFFENRPAGRFLTTSGVGINGVTYDDGGQNVQPATATQRSLDPGDVVAQIGDDGLAGSNQCTDQLPCIPASGGLVVTFRPYHTGDETLVEGGTPSTGSVYRPTVRRLFSWRADGASDYQWDLAVVGHADGVGENGTVAYLAGHVIPLEGAPSPQISTALRRVFLNNLFSVELPFPEVRVAHAGVTVDDDLMLFKGSTSAVDGRGHVEAYDSAADLTAPLWDAANEMPADSARRIFTHDGSADAAHLPNLIDVTPNNPLMAALLDRAKIERLRGRVLDATTGTYADLANRVGPIDHSTAVAVGPSLRVPGAAERPRNVYVGTRDGLLEAIDAASGTGSPAGSGVEQWALVPRSQIDLFASNVDADLGVDGSPTAADLWFDADGDGLGEYRTVLTVPMGSSSPHVLALDITDRTTPRVLWELTDTGTIAMGFASKTAMGHIVQTDTDGNLVRTAAVWVATSRYRQTESGGLSVYCFRVADGEKLWEFHKLYTSGVNDIPPPVVAVDPDRDGFVETLIAADNEGRVWAIDARTGKSLYCNDDPSFCDDPKPLYPANNGMDVDRPIGASPAVVAEGGQLIVLFGTGGYDWAPAETVQQRFAGILVPAHGEPIELFNLLLDPGDRIYSSPVVDRNAHYLFLGKSQGRIGGGATPADAGGTARVQTYDISRVLEGNQVDPTTNSADDVVLNQTLPGGLQIRDGAVFGATTAGEAFQHGAVVGGVAVARPKPLDRLYWRVVPLATP